MKAQTSAALFVALLFFATSSSSPAQPVDCYGIQCPTRILAPCEGVYGARVGFSVTASNLCNPTILPTITYSSPPGSVFPPGTNVVCATIQIPGLPARQCCFEVVVDNCCSTNCIELICPSDITVPCQLTGGAPGALLNLPKPQATNYCGDHIVPTILQVRCTPPVGGAPVFFPPGTNTVICCLSDGQNFTKCCCFKVAVTNCPTANDPCQPQLVCPTNLQIQCENPNGAIVSFPPPRLLDPCGLALVLATNYSQLSGTFFPNGKTTVASCVIWRNLATGAVFTNCCCFDVVVRCCPTNCVSTLTCPTNILVDCPPSTGLVLNYSVFGTNNCEPTTVVCNPPPGTIINGPVTVCCKLMNFSGITLTQCCFNVTIRPDTTPPTILCPSNIVVVSANCTPIDVFYPAPTASDNCQLDSVTCAPLSGSIFPVGITTVTCCAVDKAGNSNCCSFSITVRCQTNCIQLVCPTNIVVDCAGPNGAVVTFNAYGTNVCTGVIVPVFCSVPAGGLFPLGVTTVCCTNTAAGTAPLSCCFTVTVRRDTTPPSILCPSNIVVTSPNCTPIDVFYPAPTASDNCQLDSVTCAPLSGSIFPVGITTVTCCAVDKAGNSNCCSFSITVRCQTNCIQLVCPSNIVVDCAGPNGAVVTFNAYGTNVCTGVIVPVLCSVPAGGLFPLGVTTVCCTNVTAGTAPLVCCFTVTVRRDTTPPSILCPSNIVVTSPNCTPIDVFYPAPTASDNCQLDSVTCTPLSGSIFPIGITTVTCCAVDKTGNSNCCSFSITVRCQTNCIQLVCPSNIVVDCAGPNGAVVTFNAYGTNVCTGVIVPVLCSVPAGGIFPLGITTVCCTNVTAGTAPLVCCFTVTVRPDNTPPSILCPSNIVVLTPNCTPIDVFYPSPSATDNCQLDSVACRPPPGSIFPPGVTTVTCCAVDKAGNSNCCSFTVTVRCPSNDCIRVVCPSNIVVDCAGPVGAVVNFNAYGTNICTGGLVPVLCSVASGSIFPLGTTTVCCTNGITGPAPVWCCFEVTVRPDTKPPEINCSSNIYILCAKPNGVKVNYIVTATDNCDTAVTLTCVPPSGSLFPLGCTNVTCTAVDRAGNASTCTFKVCVLPQGCYLANPSFEVLNANLPAPNNCGDPISFAPGWTAFIGTPDLFRPPFASLAPGNCRGREKPCQGTNYAGLEGGYTTTGAFTTEAMMGTLIVPLNNGQKFRLRACLSLAESSTAPVVVEFVLANSANPAQQQVIHQVTVAQQNGWLQYQPPCFTVPTFGNWDRLIIRMAQVGPGIHTYPVGYAYVDNVNICCCGPIVHKVVLSSTTVTVTWEGSGQLQGASAFTDATTWIDITSPVDMDPDTGEFSTRFPRPPTNLFFRVVGPDTTPDCAACGSGG